MPETVPPPSHEDDGEDHRHGHRQRLRDRFSRGGRAALQDYEVLELLLCRSLPRRDVKPLAKLLLSTFGSLPEVLGAPLVRLRAVKGIGESVALDLKLVEAVAQDHARAKVERRNVLSSWSAVIDYCRATMAYAEKELFRILFLDKRNGLIADEVQQTGTVDHTPVYPREVLKRALELSASAVILVHNHPSGDPTPSQADIRLTREIADAGKPLGVLVHDHVIVGRQGHASLRGLGLI